MSITRKDAIKLARNMMAKTLPEMGQKEQDSWQIAMIVRALGEAGVNATLWERDLILDPEQAERPMVIYAVKIGRIYLSGLNEDGWDPIAEWLRTTTRTKDDYLEMGAVCRHDLNQWKMLGNNADTWDTRPEYVWAKAQVEQALFERQTEATGPKKTNKSIRL